MLATEGARCDEFATHACGDAVLPRVPGARAASSPTSVGVGRLRHVEELDPDLVAAGFACADLIAYPKRWINRRVETVEMLSQEETRRRVSVDFTLSADQRAALTTRHGQVVPISVLSKHPLRHFDLRDERDAAMPILNRADNAELAVIALLGAALGALDQTPSGGVLEELTADLRRIVFEDEDVALEALGALVAQARAGDKPRAAVWQDPRCRSLLRTLASDYVLFAALFARAADRRVLKYSYGEDFPLEPPWARRRDKYAPAELAWRSRNPDRNWFVINCPAAWRASSFHLEIAIPEELRVAHAELKRFPREDADGDIEGLGVADTWVNRASLYAAEPIAPHEDIRATVEIVSEREGAAARAALTAATVAVLLWCGWLSGLDASQPGAAVSLLLAGGAVLSGFAAAGRHVIVDSILRSRRRMLLLVVVCALTASASLAMELPSRSPLEVWLGAALICSAAALRLAWSAVRAAR